MKNSIISALLSFGLLSTFSGCQVIGDIFKTGVGVGVFIVIFIIVVILLVVNKAKN